MQNGVNTGVCLRRYAFDDKYESFIKSLEDSLRVSSVNIFLEFPIAKSCRMFQ